MGRIGVFWWVCVIWVDGIVGSGKWDSLVLVGDLIVIWRYWCREDSVGSVEWCC